MSPSLTPPPPSPNPFWSLWIRVGQKWPTCCSAFSAVHLAGQCRRGQLQNTWSRRTTSQANGITVNTSMVVVKASVRSRTKLRRHFRESPHKYARTHARTHTHARTRTHARTDALLVRAYNVPRVITWNDSPVTSVINLSWGRERSVWVVVGFSGFNGGRRLLWARFRGVNSKVRSVNFFTAQAREFRFGSVVLLNVLGCRLT